MRKKIGPAAVTTVLPMLKRSAAAGIATLTGGRLGRRSDDSVTRTAMKGLGAAALALPFGVWLGRKLTGQTGAERR